MKHPVLKFLVVIQPDDCDTGTGEGFVKNIEKALTEGLVFHSVDVLLVEVKTRSVLEYK